MSDQMKSQNSYLTVTPTKGQYAIGETAVMNLSVTLAQESPVVCDWTVYRLHHPVLKGSCQRAALAAGETHILPISLADLPAESGAYGFYVSVKAGEEQIGETETAFDFAGHWREAPRYGFLSDFSPEDGGDDSDTEYLNRHHINIVQYYDWMWRHDRLLPEEDTFTDPMGKVSSLAVIREKISALRKRGIASIAYAAVYGGLTDYAEEHPEQVLYRADGKSYNLIDLFHIMDISPDSAWTEHIVGEFAKVIGFGFDGLHLDQYGFPKKAVRRVDGKASVVALKELYPAFIAKVREAVDQVREDTGLIFNNVSNYPPQTTATAPQDVVYVEVWDPVSQLGHLKPVIDRARELSGKQVILAAYLPAFNPHDPKDQSESETGAQLAMGAIFANGGYHLLLGEHENILTQAYYPDYGEVSEKFKGTIQHYYDFIVQYRELLYDHDLDDISLTFSGGINQEIVFSKDGVAFDPHQTLGKVWTIIKEKPGYTVIHLLNHTGIDNDVWHEPKKQRPDLIENIVVRAEILEEVEGVYVASPDGSSVLPTPLAYAWVSGPDGRPVLEFTVPRLDCWTMVYIATKAGVAVRL